jgi:flagellin-like hook-associated protein FlgL
MAINDVSLTTGMRKNLVSLKETVKFIDRTQERLSTGKRINSALDNPVNYFTAQGHMNRASDLDVRKDAMLEATQAVRAADNGIKGINGLIENAKGLSQAARSANSEGRASLAERYNEIINQMIKLAQDSGYDGLNLLNNDKLTVVFNEDGSSMLTVDGFDASANTGLGIKTAQNAWLTETDIDAAVTDLNNATEILRSQSAALAANMSIITVRLDFTTNMINTLTEGADNLTLADMNEEGANMLMLQTRQSLGTTALSLSSQAAQSVLKLF